MYLYRTLYLTVKNIFKGLMVAKFLLYTQRYDKKTRNIKIAI